MLFLVRAVRLAIDASKKSPDAMCHLYESTYMIASCTIRNNEAVTHPGGAGEEDIGYDSSCTTHRAASGPSDAVSCSSSQLAWHGPGQPRRLTV